MKKKYSPASAGAKGGRARTLEKIRASRRNGRKGGRPKKPAGPYEPGNIVM